MTTKRSRHTTTTDGGAAGAGAVARAGRRVLSCARFSLVNPHISDGPSMSLQVDDIACLRSGLAYLRGADYFAAHDAWEEVWQGLRGRQRLFWQAMIQLAVGAYHYTNGNRRGCQGQWRKALQKCHQLGGIDEEPLQPVALLAGVLETSLQALADGQNPLPGLADFAANTVCEDWFLFS